MARARQGDEWNRTSHILSLLYNLNRSQSSSAKAPSEFNPFAPKVSRKRQVVAMMKISELRDVFMGAFASMRGGAPALIGGGTTPVNPTTFMREPSAGPQRSSGVIL